MKCSNMAESSGWNAGFRQRTMQPVVTASPSLTRKKNDESACNTHSEQVTKNPSVSAFPLAQEGHACFCVQLQSDLARLPFNRYAYLVPFRGEQTFKVVYYCASPTYNESACYGESPPSPPQAKRSPPLVMRKTIRNGDACNSEAPVKLSANPSHAELPSLLAQTFFNYRMCGRLKQQHAASRTSPAHSPPFSIAIQKYGILTAIQPCRSSNLFTSTTQPLLPRPSAPVLRAALISGESSRTTE